MKVVLIDDDIVWTKGLKDITATRLSSHLVNG